MMKKITITYIKIGTWILVAIAIGLLLFGIFRTF